MRGPTQTEYVLDVHAARWQLRLIYVVRQKPRPPEWRFPWGDRFFRFARPLDGRLVFDIGPVSGYIEGGQPFGLGLFVHALSW